MTALLRCADRFPLACGTDRERIMRMFGQMRLGARWAALGAVASAVVLLGGNAAAATGWTVVTVPQTGIPTVLNGAFARTGTDVWAVGEEFGASGHPAPPP